MTHVMLTKLILHDTNHPSIFIVFSIIISSPPLPYYNNCMASLLFTIRLSMDEKSFDLNTLELCFKYLYWHM